MLLCNKRIAANMKNMINGVVNMAGGLVLVVFEEIVNAGAGEIQTAGDFGF